VRIEIPYQGERIYRGAIRGVRRLKNHEDRNRVDGVLESPAEEARAMRLRDDPAISKARGPHAGVLRDSIRPVPSRRPKLYFIPIRLRPVLRAHRRGEAGEKQSAKKQQHCDGLNK
jgi:hypothetical protein